MLGNKIRSLIDRLALWWQRSQKIKNLVNECEKAEADLLEVFFLKYCPRLESEKESVNYPDITWRVLKDILKNCTHTLDRCGYAELSASISTVESCGCLFQTDLLIPFWTTPAGLDKAAKKSNKRSRKYAHVLKRAVLASLAEFVECEPPPRLTKSLDDGLQACNIERLEERLVLMSNLMVSVENMKGL
jgi:hypothetical protein